MPTANYATERDREGKNNNSSLLHVAFLILGTIVLGIFTPSSSIAYSPVVFFSFFFAFSAAAAAREGGRHYYNLIGT